MVLVPLLFWLPACGWSFRGCAAVGHVVCPWSSKRGSHMCCCEWLVAPSGSTLTCLAPRGRSNMFTITVEPTWASFCKQACYMPHGRPNVSGTGVVVTGCFPPAGLMRTCLAPRGRSNMVPSQLSPHGRPSASRHQGHSHGPVTTILECKGVSPLQGASCCPHPLEKFKALPPLPGCGLHTWRPCGPPWGVQGRLSEVLAPFAVAVLCTRRGGVPLRPRCGCFHAAPISGGRPRLVAARCRPAVSGRCRNRPAGVIKAVLATFVYSLVQTFVVMYCPPWWEGSWRGPRLSISQLSRRDCALCA